MMLKQCSKCGIFEDVTEFDKDKSRKDGFQCWCRSCRKKQYEEHKEQRKHYLKEHKDPIQKRQKKYRTKHKDTIQRVRRKYYEAHTRERKKYSEEHKEEKAGYQSKYYKTKKGRECRRRNCHERRARENNTEATLTAMQWEYILKKQDNRCNICGKKFTTKRPATQDHIIPAMHNGSYSSDNIQALCKSCNCSKCAKLDKGYIQIWNMPIF